MPLFSSAVNRESNIDSNCLNRLVWITWFWGSLQKDCPVVKLRD